MTRVIPALPSSSSSSSSSSQAIYSMSRGKSHIGDIVGEVGRERGKESLADYPIIQFPGTFAIRVSDLESILALFSLPSSLARHRFSFSSPSLDQCRTIKLRHCASFFFIFSRTSRVRIIFELGHVIQQDFGVHK